MDTDSEKYSLQSPEDLKKAPPEAQQESAAAEAIPMWPGVVSLMVDWKTGREYLKQVTLFENLRKGSFGGLFLRYFYMRISSIFLFNMAVYGFLEKR